VADMLRQGVRVISPRRVLPLLVAAAVVAPFVSLLSAGALPGCCVQTMPCCPEPVAAPQGRASAPPTTVVGAPVPACCQTLLPAGAPAPADRKGTVPAPAPIAVAAASHLPEVALPSTGRAPLCTTTPAEDPPSESCSARAPPLC
jgi:hypothetical protein